MMKDMFHATAVMLTYNQKTIKHYHSLHLMEINSCTKTSDQIGQESALKHWNWNNIEIIAKVHDWITLRNHTHASFQYKIKYIPLWIFKVDLDGRWSSETLQYTKRRLVLHNTLRNNYSYVTLNGGCFSKTVLAASVDGHFHVLLWLIMIENYGLKLHLCRIPSKFGNIISVYSLYC